MAGFYLRDTSSFPCQSICIYYGQNSLGHAPPPAPQHKHLSFPLPVIFQPLLPAYLSSGADKKRPTWGKSTGRIDVTHMKWNKMKWNATTKLKTCDFVCQLITALVCVCILITCSLVKCHTTWCGHADFKTCTSMCCSAMNGCMQSCPPAPCRLFSVTLKIHATTLRTGKQPGW